MKALLATLALVAASHAQALDFKGVAPGEPYDQKLIEQKIRAGTKVGGNSTISEFSVFSCNDVFCSGYADIGIGVVDVEVTQKDGVVTEISFDAITDFYDMIVQSLTEKFGPARATKNLRLQNAFGAQFTGGVKVWTKDRAALTVTQRWTIDRMRYDLTIPQTERKKTSL